MTTAMKGEAMVGLFGSGKAAIDWGNGSAPETVTFKTTTVNCTHYFSDATSRTIVINGYIRDMRCDDLQLTAIDVTKNTALEYLGCFSNQLTSLDVGKNTVLKDLRCGSNQLTSLDVSNCTALELLYCGNNQLTDLDVTKNPALTELQCHSNQLTAEELNALFGTLHSNAGNKIYILAVILARPVATGVLPQIRAGKWMIKRRPASEETTPARLSGGFVFLEDREYLCGVKTLLQWCGGLLFFLRQLSFFH